MPFTLPINLIPALIKNSSSLIGGSKQKWEAWRMAVAWYDADGEWEFPAGGKSARKKHTVSKLRVRAFRAEHGQGDLDRLVKAWRTKMKQRSGFDDKLKNLIEGS